MHDYTSHGYDPDLDKERLENGYGRVFKLMRDGVWRTLAEVTAETNVPEASVSAHFRQARRAEAGGHHVARQRRGDPKAGLYEYRLRVNTGNIAEKVHGGRWLRRSDGQIDLKVQKTDISDVFSEAERMLIGQRVQEAIVRAEAEIAARRGIPVEELFLGEEPEPVVDEDPQGDFDFGGLLDGINDLAEPHYST